jgi:hypothetical protein
VEQEGHGWDREQGTAFRVQARFVPSNICQRRADMGHPHPQRY